MKKLLLTNVVYGQPYMDIFLDYHLEAMLDDQNIPNFKDRIEYEIYTDDDTLPIIQHHNNFLRMSQLVPIHVKKFTWPQNANRFHERYSVLVSTFRMSVQSAMEKDYFLSALVADLVPAKEFLGKILKRLDEGFDSVFMLPPRSAYEAMAPALSQIKGALHSKQLFELAYANMHPLWVACHWESQQFTKLPFTLLWNTGSGLLARAFSITPIAFVPKHEMLSTGLIDVEAPQHCKNPYWARNWDEAPILGVEPLKCYYPPFNNSVATPTRVREFAKNLHPSQLEFLKERLWYPNEETVRLPAYDKSMSDGVVREVLKK